MEEKFPVGVKIVVGIVVAIVGITLLVALSPFTIVDAGERAVITDLGKVDRTLDAGIHWVTPLIESVNTFNVQTLKETVDASSASKDMQDVKTTIAVTYNLNPNTLDALYTNVGAGSTYVRVIIDPSLQESIKAATANYTAEELITKRPKVTEEILANVKKAVLERTVGDYISITAIAITDFEFSPSFNASIEAKVKAEQDALTAKNKLEQVKFEAAQRVAQATAEAEAIRISAQAINSQGGEDYVQLEAIKKWNGVLPAQMIPGATVPFINLTK